ncbi:MULTISPECIES: PepSY-associated TM helix domain-containing protein [unclassified Streptomyces]|uniref:PepSY-associated TM helix domain-containing protein n=1 Tax=unclassified Streptomyces TaxID=2593676 RepID=UPI002E33D1D1|nr:MULTISPECIES: PepSY domain-containing protein [unclassified Streptomyces]WUC66719.1 PepSY domain-containing protein [Streptomyces sp. NBC_00539]
MSLDALHADPSRAAEAPSDPPAGAPAARTPGAWAALRPLLLRMHFYAGLLIAPLLFVAAATGLLYAGSWQAEKILYSDELTVARVGDHTLPLGDQVEAAKSAAPQGEVVAVWPAPDAGSTTRVIMEKPGLAEGENLTVFVDPYTADVRGKLTTAGDALPLRAWLSGLHADLRLGAFGRNYSELAASWLWVVALGGLALWAGRRRSRRALLVLPDRAATGRRRTLSWHGAVGLWAAAGLVALSATGLTWSKYAGENIGQLQDGLGGATPTVSAALPGGAGANGGDEHAGHLLPTPSGGTPMTEGMEMPPPPPTVDVGIDRVVASARAAGVTESLRVTLPVKGKGYVVKEADKQVPVHLDSVAVDPADGRVIDELRFADYPLLAQLTRFGIDLHMGLTFGAVNQLALAALAVALMFLVFWGYRMWWLRRPTRQRAFSVGRAHPRGAWRKLPVTLLLPLAAVTAVVGWFVPMLGLSLCGFLAVDVLLGFVARRRAAAR